MIDHGWDEKLIQIKVNREPSTQIENLSQGDDSAKRKDKGWKNAVVICNDEYENGSGFPNLVSARADFQPLIETLGNDHRYNLSVMGPKTECRYDAGPDSTFVEEAEDRKFINADNVWSKLDEYVNTVKNQMKMKNNTQLASFLFYFIITTISSIVQLLEERLHAENFFLLL